MDIQHPQEHILPTYGYNGIYADLAEWSDTVRRGKIGYANHHVDEPNVEKVMGDFMSISAAPNSREDPFGRDVIGGLPMRFPR